MDESGTDEADCQRICARVFDEPLFMPVLMYGSDTIIWKKVRSSIRDLQRDNLTGLLDIKRMDKVPNACIRELWWMKGLMKVFPSSENREYVC